MVQSLYTFSKEESILEAIHAFTNMNLNGSLVLDHEEQLIGILTKEALLKGISENKSLLSEIMLEPGTPIYEDDEIKTAVTITQEVYPVRNKFKEYVGLLTRKELLEAFSTEVSLELSHLDVIFNSAHNGILSIDDRGFITSLNPAAEKMAGVTKDFAIGRFVTDIVTPKGLLEVLRTGDSATEKYKVGNRKYITNRSPILKDNKVVGAVGLFQDISEIEFISNELNTVKKLLAELDTVIDSVNDGVLILDRFGSVIKANEAFQQILGIEKIPLYYQELLGDYLNTDILTSVLKEEKRVTILETNKSSKNQLMITATPVENRNPNEYRIVLTIRDISEIDNLRKELRNTKNHLNQMIENKRSSREFIAHSSNMRELIINLEQIANVDSTVLLLGESGVGKEEISNIIHEHSQRKSQPFIKVNCGAIPESLVDSELFGYDTGAFTGAKKGGKLGYFERAHGGTIFLDEIGELPLAIQVKLLRVLQEREIIRVGGSKSVPIDVRVIAATNKDLLNLVHEKKFRKDLYYRLNVIPIKIPPLRERVEDIPFLIKLFQERVCFKYGINKVFSDEAIQLLTQYQWPGNVRELVNMVERLVVTMNRPVIEKEDVIHLLHQQPTQADNGLIHVDGILPLKEAVELVEKQLIQKAMKLYKNTRKSADVLQVNQSTVVRKIQKYSIDKIFIDD